MRAMIETVESRVLLAAHLPSVGIVSHYSTAVHKLVTKTKAASAKGIATLRSDFKRLKLSASQSSLITTLASDFNAGAATLLNDITTNNSGLLQTWSTVLVDARNYAKNPTDTSAFAKLESDINTIISKASGDLSSLIAAGNTVAQKLNSDLSQIAAADTTDPKLQADAQKYIAVVSQGESAFATAAENWLNSVSKVA